MYMFMDCWKVFMDFRKMHPHVAVLMLHPNEFDQAAVEHMMEPGPCSCVLQRMAGA